MRPISDYVRSQFAHLDPRQLLLQRCSVLLGVTDAAAAALETVQCYSVFDLSTSRIFANATALNQIAAAQDNLFSRFGYVSADAIDNSRRNLPIGDLAAKPIDVLDGIGATSGPAISAALSVSTVRELALWPPFLAAVDIQRRVLLPEALDGFDPEAPDDLLPKSGEYPTEKVFYRSVVIDDIEGAAQQDLSSAGPVDVTAMNLTGFDHPATGAIITMEQVWYAQGVALGNLLHSVALAPGESTKIAMIDWSRRVAGKTSENIAQTEDLSSVEARSRAISEVTNAVANETQTGNSTATTDATSFQEGVGFGIFEGILAEGVGMGIGATSSVATSVSGSSGRRELAASMTQSATDRTEQHANSARNRRASIIQEVTQSESEKITTRIVTNYNHMHALSVQYYEVVQIYRVSTDVASVEKCLFVPMKIITNWTPELIRRYLAALVAAAPSGRIRQALQQGADLVEILPMTPPYLPNHPNNESEATLRTNLDAARAATGANVAADTRDTWKLPATTRVVSLAVGGARYEQETVASLVVTMRDGSTREAAGTGSVLSIDLDEDLLDIASVTATMSSQYTQPTNLPNFRYIWGVSAVRVALKLRYEAAAFDEVVVRRIGDNWRDLSHEEIRRPDWDDVGGLGFEGKITVPVLSMEPRGIGVTNDVLYHLQANAAYYSQAIWAQMDSATLSLALSSFTYHGKPLLQQVDPTPVAVSGNYVGFRMNVDEADKAAFDEWQLWLDQHGFNKPDIAQHRTVPLPSGGVFAEAVLGRFNAAEKIDLTRFWNWKDSPIPLQAPDIAAINADSRKDQTNLQPGHLDAPAVSLVSPPALPDPTGLSSVLTALTAATMFRDMSNMATTTGLAQAAATQAGQGAQAGMTGATTMAKTTADAYVETMKAVIPLITALLGSGGSSGGGSSSATGSLSGIGGMMNIAKLLDAAGAGGTAGGGAAGGAAASGGETVIASAAGEALPLLALASTAPPKTANEQRAFEKLLNLPAVEPQTLPGPSYSPSTSTGGGLLEGGPHSYTRELLLAGFAVNGSELTAEHTEALSTLVSYMSEAPVAEYGILSVIGRASQTGSETNNQQLSLARANAAALFLRAQGVPADHIGTVKGYGSQVPLTNQPGIEAAANRSVVLTFVFVVDQEQGVAPTPTTGGSRHWGLSVTLAGGAGHVGIGGGFFVGRLKNIDSGAIRTITFAGAGVGVGLSTPGATPDLSFEEFTTGAPYVMDDFKGQLAVMTGMSGGFMVGYGAARFSIPFMGVDVLLTGLNYGQVGWDASANVGTILFP